MKFSLILIPLLALASVPGRADTISGHVDAGGFFGPDDVDAPINFSDGLFNSTTETDPGYFANATDSGTQGFVHEFATASIPLDADSAAQYAHAGVLFDITDTVTDTNPNLAIGTPDPTFGIDVSMFGTHDAITADEPLFEEDAGATILVEPGVGPAGCFGVLTITSNTNTAVCALPNAVVGESFTVTTSLSVAVYVQGGTPFTSGTVDFSNTFDIYGGSAAGSYLVSTNGYVYDTSAADATPEPASWILAACGVLALAWRRRGRVGRA